jgi:hypothetical protein
MVSPKPLSVFVPDVTLIAFPIPARLYPHGGRTLSSRESNARSRQENGLDTEVEGHSGANPESALVRYYRCGVLDGCSRARNQAPDKNLPIH